MTEVRDVDVVVSNPTEQAILSTMEHGQLDWTSLYATLQLLHKTIDEHKAEGEPPPDGVAASAGLIANLLLIANNDEATPSERRNHLWNWIGLGNITSDTTMRDNALAGCMEIMRRMGKSETDIEGSAEFALIGIPASAFKRARQQTVKIPEDYGKDHLPHFLEQLALFQKHLPKKGPSES